MTSTRSSERIVVGKGMSASPRTHYVSHLETGRDHGIDDAAKCRLSLHRSVSGERVVDVATFEVATVGADSRLVFVPGP